MLVRRLLIVLAVLMALTAVTAGLSPREPVRDGEPTPAAPAAPAGGGSTEPSERTISAEESGQTVQVRSDESLRLTVEGDVLDDVAVGELGVESIAEDSPAIFDLLVGVPGSYPITLLGSERRIGTLEVAG